MSNMSYCRWQNTLSDLRDCAASLEEQMNDESVEKLSADERSAALAMMDVMAEMLGAVGVSIDSDEHEIMTLAADALDSLDGQREGDER